MLRMIQDAFTLHFIPANVQPLLQDNNRTTFLPIQSFSCSILIATTFCYTTRCSGGVSSLTFAVKQVLLGV